MRLFWIIIIVMLAGLGVLIASQDTGTVFGMASDSFASILYASLWGAVLIVGIIGARTPLRDIARDIAYWLLIILVLMTGYQYRYELQDVANRLTAGIIPGSPLTISGSPRAAVMLDKARNGHFQVRMEVNGATILALVDTGATTTVLTADDAERAGIATEDLLFTIPVMTANGQAMAAWSSIETLSIGPIERNRVPVLISQPGQLAQSLLGMQFLSSLSSFEMRGDRLILTD